MHVNLIPLNPTPGSKWTASDPADEREFVRRLEAKGIPTTVRDTRGREIDGACGQLAAAPTIRLRSAVLRRWRAQTNRRGRSARVRPQLHVAVLAGAARTVAGWCQSFADSSRASEASWRLVPILPPQRRVPWWSTTVVKIDRVPSRLSAISMIRDWHGQSMCAAVLISHSPPPPWRGRAQTRFW